MKLNQNDIRRLNDLIESNPTLKGQIDKIMQLWSLVDSEYVSVKSELDQVDEKLKNLNHERTELNSYRRKLIRQMESMIDGDDGDQMNACDSDDYDSEDKEEMKRTY